MRYAFGLFLIGYASYIFFSQFLFPEIRGDEVKRKWVLTDAEIISSVVEKRIKRKSVGYFPVIRYQYSFEGTKYITDQYSLSPNNLARLEFLAEKKANEYSTGDQLKVYVNPTNPQNAVIRAGADWNIWIIGIVIVLFVSGVLFMLPITILQKMKIEISKSKHL
ncbi:MAG: DUF3592 domain-containing protein [Symploca sp. SIO2C1]|nr:DUF3592 domain-containing protein [Symploca sp. SIO2C1]